MAVSIEQKQDMKMLMYIHTFLGFAVLAVLMFFFGCKEIKEQKATLGSEVEAQSINTALVTALGNKTPWDMRKGEAVLYDYTQEIEGGAPSLFAQTSIQVFATEDFEYDSRNFLRVYFVGTQFDAETGETKEVSFQEEYDPAFYNQNAFEADELIFNNQSVTSNLLTQKMAPLEDRDVVRESYHNLRVKLLRMAPPAPVSSAPNCGGVPNCELRVTRISFDKAEWYNETEFLKITFEYDISLDSPYMALFLRKCQAQQIPVENRKYFVRSCEVARDFLYGQ